MEMKCIEQQLLGEGRYKITFNHDALEDLRIDLSELPEEKRYGIARRFLAASATWCTCGVLKYALKARGVNISDMTAESSVQMGKDEKGRNVVVRIDIDISVDIPEENREDLERYHRLVEAGCLVSRSLERGIEVNHSITLKD